MKKTIGFFLNFGYAESGRVGKIHLRSLHGYFPSLREAASDLAHYLLEDYLAEEEYAEKGTWEPSIEGFQAYLYELPTHVASGGIGSVTFLESHTNGERWWAWDSMAEIYPLLDMFYEIEESAEVVLPRFLDPAKIEDKRMAEEVTDYLTPKSDDKHARRYWDRFGSEEMFKPVIEVKSEP